MGFSYQKAKFVSEVKFVKLPESRPHAESILEIHIGSKIKIHVDAQFDPELLIHVLKAIRGVL